MGCCDERSSLRKVEHARCNGARDKNRTGKIETGTEYAASFGCHVCKDSIDKDTPRRRTRNTGNSKETEQRARCFFAASVKHPETL